jgi:hypothetical protein
MRQRFGSVDDLQMKSELEHAYRPSAIVSTGLLGLHHLHHRFRGFHRHRRRERSCVLLHHLISSVDWVGGWLIGWLIGWLVSWLVVVEEKLLMTWSQMVDSRWQLARSFDSRLGVNHS